MKHIGILLSLIMLGLVFGSWTKKQPDKNRKPIAGHVILIGADGFSSIAVRQNPGAFPNIEKLMREGSYTLSRRSVLPSSSAANWSSMLMGAGTELHGYTTALSKTPEVPSRVVTENGLFPCIMYVMSKKYPGAEVGAGYTWPTIGCLYDQKSVKYNYANPTKDEEKLCETMCAYIEQNKPMFTFIAFDQPDGSGHKFGWETPGYIDQCRTIDSYVGRILDSAEKAGIADDLIVIFTSDHGGIDNGHGGKTLNEMEAPFVVWGKNIRAGHVIDESMMVYDTAPTITHILGLQQPQVWIGRPVMSIFKQSVFRKY